MTDDPRKYHQKTIYVGKGIVPYVLGGIHNGQLLPAGWVLPGGERTTSPVIARYWATLIDAALRAGVNG